MNPKFEKFKKVIAFVEKVLLAICTLLTVLGVLIIARSLINVNFLNNYNKGKYPTVLEGLLPHLPFGENYVAFYNLGNADYMKGNYDKAVSYYATALTKEPPEQYEGEPCFLLLPNRDLTDEELLQVVDAYGQLGLTLDPNTLSWHNCMRGGGIEVGIRSFRGDENERRSELTGLYTRAGLRPETPFTDLVIDDGVGRVALDEEDFNGLEGFRFRPARRLTDEELLQLIALDQGDMTATPEELSGYETQLRQELHLLLGMPLSARRGTYEAVEPFDSGNAYGDSRMAYSSSFTEVGGTGRRWRGSIDVATGRLIEGSVDLDDRYYTDGLMVSDIRMDPWDEKWASIAVEAVTAHSNMEESGITEIRTWSETNLNELQGVEVRIMTSDGGVYRAEISYVLEEVMMLRYNDAVSIAAEDDYYAHFMEEVPVNE